MLDVCLGACDVIAIVFIYDRWWLMDAEDKKKMTDKCDDWN